MERDRLWKALGVIIGVALAAGFVYLAYFHDSGGLDNCDAVRVVDCLDE